MSKTMNDIELLKSCLMGSTRSFEILVQRYQSLVCALTYGATGNVDKSEELAQETFFLAWKNLRQLKDLGKFKAWLCQIARRVIQSWLRVRKRESIGKAALMEKASSESYSISPTEVAIQQEQQAVVDQAIEIIPESYRVPLILFYRENKSTREVAAIIGLNENTTRQRISRARALLKGQVAAMVETSLARSKPGKAFTAGVLTSVAGLSIKGAATTTAAHAVTTGLSALTVKITGIAAGLLLAAGVTYMTIKPKPSNSTSPPTQTQSESIRSSRTESATVTPQEKPDQSDNPIEEAPQDALATDQAVATDPSPPSSDVSQPYEFKPKGLLSGLITDIETGEPVINATVRVSNNYIFEAQTDAHGFYSIDKIAQPGQYDIAIDCPPYLGIPVSQDNPVIPLTKDAHATKHFQLARACMVELRVVDVNGVDIKDAKVVATSPSDDQKKVVSYFGEKRSTDANGFLLLGGFAASKHEYLITVSHEGPYRKKKVHGKTISYPSNDYAPEKATVICTDTDIIEQRTVVLKKGQAVHGFVAYADGEPAADIDIMARPAWWHSNWTVCGSPVQGDGTFEFTHITPGDYTICAFFSDTGVYHDIMQTSLPLDPNSPLIVQLTQNSPHSLVSISGTLVFEGESHPRTISVHAYSPQLGHAFATISPESDDGIENRFTLNRLEPGSYRVTFSGNGVKERILEAVQAPCTDLEVTLTPQKKITLQGTVVDAKTSLSIQSFRARAIKLRTLRGPGYVQKKHWGSFQNDHGVFSLDTVGPGIYQVQILTEGYAPALSAEINTDDPGDTVLSLTSGGTLTGTVTDQQGTLVTGAKVIPLSFNEDGAVATAQGLFTLNHLPAGFETLKVMHPDYAPSVIRTAEILEGQTLEGLNIILQPGGTLEGVVYDDQGQPLAKEVLYVQDETGYGGSSTEMAGRLATVVTDVNGFYRIEHLPAQRCYVERAEKWTRLGVVQRSVIPEDGQVMPFDFGGWPLLSGMAMAEGEPLVSTRLLLGTKMAPDFGPFKCVTETDDQGAFTFRGTVPGRFSIHYKKDKDWIRMTEIEVPATDLDLGLIDTESTQLAIHIKQSSTPRKIIQLYLGLPNRKISGPVHRLVPPTEADEPCLISNVEPGQYTLVLTCSDHLQLYQDITLEPGQSPWEVSVNLPEETGGLSATLRPGQTFSIWQDIPKMLVTIQADDQGRIFRDNLPVGSYSVGTILQWLYDITPLTQLNVSADENTHLDLDQFTMPDEELSTLVVQIVGPNGDISQETELWLSCSLGELEPYMSSPASTMFVAATGDHVLHVASPGYKPIDKAVHIKAHAMGSDPDKVIIELEAQ